MKALRRIWLLAIVASLCRLSGSAAPAPGIISPGVPQTNGNSRSAPPPPLPIVKSPVVLFRELLAMNPSERKQALATRTPESRKQILAKVREYEALRPDLRELRLKATELRWYLLPLLNMAATNRAAQLSLIPPEDRKLVEDRLRLWDALPPQNQVALMTNQMTLRRLTELEEGNAPVLSEARRKLLEDGIKQWQALSEEERENIKTRFDQVFNLTTQDKAKVLRTLSEQEREQIQRTLRRFGQLPPAQRAQCVSNFEKFANLNVEERQQFLKNAERWNQMTPDERQAWRDLVQKFQPQPPLPPRFPPVPRRPRPSQSVATGTNHN